MSFYGKEKVAWVRSKTSIWEISLPIRLSERFLRKSQHVSLENPPASIRRSYYCPTRRTRASPYRHSTDVHRGLGCNRGHGGRSANRRMRVGRCRCKWSDSPFLPRIPATPPSSCGPRRSSLAGVVPLAPSRWPCPYVATVSFVARKRFSTASAARGIFLAHHLNGTH